MAQAHELVVQHGLTINEVFPPGSRQGRKLGKVALKYRDPATGKTWSGRGKPP
ncbi:MAG: H-NS histone family protein [Burkholderiaceae bacterium]|nr:H-NS histone family protein [Burkholderiaceae bacterium]